jgi:hypothetical protein
VISALAFIDSGKNDDGGYAYQPGGPSDANTTAAVVQAQLSLCKYSGDNLCATSDIDYLMGVQEQDGSFAGPSALYSTQEVIPALMQRALGIRPAPASAAGPNQAGLVVRLGDGEVLTRCVEFEEAEISGHDLLLRAGLQVVSRQEPGNGSTICAIEEVGCPATNCFCQCNGSTCTYWSYWSLVGDQWSYAQLGVDSQMVQPGAVEGWSWGEKEEPPVMSFEEICAPETVPPEPTATATVVPTSTPAPPSTSAAKTEATKEQPEPTNTSSPTAVPAATATAAATATPLPDEGEDVSATRGEGARVRTNYVVFGVLVAVLVGAVIVIWVRSRRR